MRALLELRVPFQVAFTRHTSCWILTKYAVFHTNFAFLSLRVKVRAYVTEMILLTLIFIYKISVFAYRTGVSGWTFQAVCLACLALSTGVIESLFANAAVFVAAFEYSVAAALLACNWIWTFSAMGHAGFTIPRCKIAILPRWTGGVCIVFAFFGLNTPSCQC